jgi:pimeloyl-ACP methyl ester carboxylesterase
MAGTRLAYEEHGPPDGLPIVLLHGFPLSRAMWSAQVDLLRYQGHRVILPDLRGHGQSPVRDGPSTMEACAADLEDLLADVGVDRFLLGGFSLGGYVALEFARQHPERLLGLALVDTRAEPDTDEARRKRHETAESVRKQGIGVLETAMMPKLLTERTRIQRRDLAESVRRLIRSMPQEGAARALEGMAQRPDQRPNLPKLRMPCLVVVGDRDELTPPDASQAMAKALPDARLVVVPEAAHLVPMEAAHALNTALLDWLAGNVTLRRFSRSETARPRSRS